MPQNQRRILFGLNASRFWRGWYYQCNGANQVVECKYERKGVKTCYGKNRKWGGGGGGETEIGPCLGRLYLRKVFETVQNARGAFWISALSLLQLVWYDK